MSLTLMSLNLNFISEQIYNEKFATFFIADLQSKTQEVMKLRRLALIN